MQNGELKALKPHQVEFSTVVQSSQLAKKKNRYYCAWLVYHLGYTTSVLLLLTEMLRQRKTEDGVLVYYLNPIFRYFPVG